MLGVQSSYEQAGTIGFLGYRKATMPGEVKIYGADEPSRQLLKLIGDKWTPIVLYVLGRGTKRYGERQQDLETNRVPAGIRGSRPGVADSISPRQKDLFA
jgi:hypothetical protein